MKIGVDIRVLMDKQYSGVSEYAYNLLASLLKLNKKENLGHQFKLFYNSFQQKIDTEVFKKYEAEVVNTKYPNKVFNYILNKGFKYPKIDKILDIDLFYMPHLNFASFSPDVKKAITIHDLSFLRFPEFFYWRKHIWHLSLEVPKMLNKFNKIVAVSDNTKRDILELCNIPQEKVVTIYSGLDKELFKKITDKDELARVKKKYSLPDRFILFLSTLEPRKNIDGLVRAYENFADETGSDLELILAGAQGWKQKNVLNKIYSYNGGGRIRRIGYIDNPDRPAVYSLATIFIYPSFFEGFGLPILEAMACGSPVIAGANSSMPEIIKNSALIIDPYNPSEIKQAIKAIIKDDFFRKKLIDKGQKSVSDYDWDTTAREYFNKIFN